jgi:TonB family protein
MASRRKKWASRAVVAIVVALGAHALVITGFIVFAPLFALPKLPASASASSSSGAQRPTEEDRPMEIETIVNQLDRPEDKTAEEKQREEEQKKEEEDKNPHGQVVDIAKPAIEQRPESSKYVSEYDSKVDKESKGPQGRDSAGARAAVIPPMGSPDVKQPQEAVPGAQETAPPGKAGKPGPLAMRDLPRHKPSPQHDGEAPRPTENGDLERAGQQGPRDPQQPAPTPQAGEGGTGAQRPSIAGRQAEVPGLPNGAQKPNLQLTPDAMQKAIGRGSGSMDYLKDVDDGELTALNSKKWKHAPFFNRVKRSVANEWHPEVVYVRHDPSGNVYGVKDRVTVLRVHLNPDGKLAAWTVLQSSGVDFLDDEAIDAFRKAAPFPNPPKDLVEVDGQIHFNFAFIFELSGRGNVKIFKYQ